MGSRLGDDGIKKGVGGTNRIPQMVVQENYYCCVECMFGTCLVQVESMLR